MTEQEIAARVAQNIPRDEPAPPAEAPVVASVPEEKGYVSNMDSSQFNLLLADYFNVSGVDKYSEEVKASIRSVQNWAYETSGSEDSEKALYAIRVLENELGSSFKPDRLARLAKFIRLKKQSEVLSLQLQAVKDSY